jgi:hypothetical protein
MSRRRKRPGRPRTMCTSSVNPSAESRKRTRHEPVRPDVTGTDVTRTEKHGRETECVWRKADRHLRRISTWSLLSPDWVPAWSPDGRSLSSLGRQRVWMNWPIFCRNSGGRSLAALQRPIMSRMPVPAFSMCRVRKSGSASSGLRGIEAWGSRSDEIPRDGPGQWCS